MHAIAGAAAFAAALAADGAPQLRELNLAQNGITDAMPLATCLLHAPRLRLLYVRGNAFACGATTAVDMLQHTAPLARIEA